MSKSLRFGPRESTLIFELERRGRTVFTFQDARDILDISDSSLANVIQRLKRKNRVDRIERGKYVLSPARSGIEGHWSESVHLVVDSLVDDYYIGFWSAMNHWDMTEQVAKITQVALTRRKRDVGYGGQKIMFITISEDRFFGEIERRTDDSTFVVSSREKTVLDALTYPQHCGGLPEATKAVWNAREELDWEGLLEYLERLDVSSVTRRLGYILETLEIERGITEELEENFTGFRWLDPTAGKDTKSYNRRWGLKINLDRETLLDWREY